MPESLRTRLARWGFNLVPAYWGTGARITYIADEYQEIRVELPLSWRTRNCVGSIFGGSMYAAVDPVYMIMLIRRHPRGACVRRLHRPRLPSGADRSRRDSTRRS